MGAGWKIFRVVNIIQMTCALLMLGLSVFNFSRRTVAPEAIGYIIFWIIILLIIIANSLLNLHLLRYLTDGIPLRWQRQLHRILTVLYTIGILFLGFGIIASFISGASMSKNSSLLIGVLIAFVFVVLSLVILPYQYRIKQLISKIYEIKLMNSIEQIGAPP